LALAGSKCVSVPKRFFKKAVDRNHLKRLLREAYRKNKHTVYDAIDKPYIFMFLFLDNKKYSAADIEKSMQQLLQDFINLQR